MDVSYAIRVGPRSCGRQLRGQEPGGVAVGVDLLGNVPVNPPAGLRDAAVPAGSGRPAAAGGGLAIEMEMFGSRCAGREGMSNDVDARPRIAFLHWRSPSGFRTRSRSTSSHAGRGLVRSNRHPTTWAVEWRSRGRVAVEQG